MAFTTHSAAPWQLKRGLGFAPARVCLSRSHSQTNNPASSRCRVSSIDGGQSTIVVEWLRCRRPLLGMRASCRRSHVPSAYPRD
jgi:hypothetical protein